MEQKSGRGTYCKERDDKLALWLEEELQWWREEKLIVAVEGVAELEATRESRIPRLPAFESYGISEILWKSDGAAKVEFEFLSHRRQLWKSD